MRKKWVLGGLVLLAVLAGAALWIRGPQEMAYTEVQYELSTTVQETLDTAYSAYSAPKAIPEYAYCITSYRVQMKPDSTPVVLVDAVMLAKADSADPQSIQYSCGAFPAIHSHPPTDCEQNEGGKWECTMSEDTTDLCEPSFDDVASTLTDWHRFHGIQCGRARFSFFVPDFLDP